MRTPLARAVFHVAVSRNGSPISLQANVATILWRVHTTVLQCRPVNPANESPPGDAGRPTCGEIKLSVQHSKRGRYSGMAKRADKYSLYQEAVQDPASDVRLARRIFEKRFGRPPHLLREDFCGTAAVSCCWVQADRNNRAWGVDLDPEPLAWGERHNLSTLAPDERERLELIEGDVREVDCDQVDVTCAFNFSYFLFKQRPGTARLSQEGALDDSR